MRLKKNLIKEDETIDFLIEEVSNDIGAKEVVEKNKNKILKLLPLKNYDNFDYELFEDILIKVIERHVEKEQYEVVDDKESMGDYDFYLESMELDHDLMESLDYTEDTGLIYTTDDNSFQANYENFIDDAKQAMDQLDYPEIDDEYFYSQDINVDDNYPEIDPEDYMDPPEDWYYVNINTLKGVLREYDEQALLYGANPNNLEKRNIVDDSEEEINGQEKLDKFF